MCQKLCKKKLGKHYLVNQKDVMEAGLPYEGHNHETMVERLFQINGDLGLFGEDAEPYSIRDMARKIIPKNLKPMARLKYIDKGGKELRDKQDILDMMETITEFLEEENEMSQQRKNQDKSNHSNNRHEKYEGDADRNSQKDEEKDTPGEMKNPCEIHDEKQRVERISE